MKLKLKVILIVLLSIIIIFAVSQSKAPEKGDVSIAVTGDVMFSRNMPSVLSLDSSPFESVGNITSNVDLLLVNFENAATTSSNPLKGDVPLKCSPEYVPLLKANNRTVAALANNHVMDYGVSGMNDTLNHLKNNNIPSIGAGLNESEAHEAYVQNISGRKITVLNYMDSNNFKEYAYSTMPYANDTHPGYSAYDLSDVQRQISKNNDSDLIIAYMHFGNEYSTSPNSEQITIAHDLIDSGVDVVLGSHPHVTQGIEMYNGKPIFYSLGNFIFDQSNPATHYAYFVEIDMINDTGKCSVYPVYINNYLPEFMSENQSNDMLKTLSDDLEIQNGVGKLEFNLTDEV